MSRKKTVKVEKVEKVKQTMSRRTGCLSIGGGLILAFVLFMIISVSRGGHMPGPTYISPENVGIVVDMYQGKIQNDHLQAGVRWTGMFDHIIEVPTGQRNINMDGDNAVPINTASNLLQADVTVQYRIVYDKAGELYKVYQDNFADIPHFEAVYLKPALIGAINSAVGDQDTATALTTVGKQQGERDALAALQKEWGPRGIEFTNLMIRGIRQDQESQNLLASTLEKMQEIDNARLTLQQQVIDNKTVIQQATAQARINRLQNSTLTDLYVQDQLLGRVDTVYMRSDDLMGILKSK